MSRSRNWCWTQFNTDVDPEQLWDLLRNAGAKYAIFQKEQASTGRLHWQGYTQFATGKSFGGVRKCLDPATHWEAQKGNNLQAKSYCSKEDTRVLGPFEFGEFSKGQGCRTDLEAFRDAIREGIDDIQLLDDHCCAVAKYPRFISFVRGSTAKARDFKSICTVYHGAPGSGKTRKAMDYAGFEHTYVVSRPDGNRPLWWDGYLPSVHTSVLIDDFYGWLPWSFLLQLTDRYPFRVEIKGGSLPFIAKNIFITSNSRPEEWYDMEKIKGANIEALLRRIEEIEEIN